MTTTRITFTQPLGNIRVDFPMEPRPSYEVSFGVVCLTKLQAEEAAQYGWKLFDDTVPVRDGNSTLTRPNRVLPEGLVEVWRPMVTYDLLKAKHQC